MKNRGVKVKTLKLDFLKGLYGFCMEWKAD
jgi:hypothetical protein